MPAPQHALLLKKFKFTFEKKHNLVVYTTPCGGVCGSRGPNTGRLSGQGDTMLGPNLVSHCLDRARGFYALGMLKSDSTSFDGRPPN